MPAHSGPDPHAHSIPARPKSSSTGRRPNTRSKMSTPVTSAGTGSAGRKIGSRTSTKVDIKQTPPTITERQENGHTYTLKHLIVLADIYMHTLTLSNI